MQRFPTMRLAAAASLIFLSQAFAQQATTDFIRVSEGGDGRSPALQTAIVTYRLADKRRNVSVDLVAAIHIGDRRYYEELNRRFRTYDALLYELVMPGGSSVPAPPAGNGGFLSGVQSLLGSFLNLSFQLEEIDYGAANFVHADLSPQELADSMSERGESLYVYFWRLYFAALEDYANDPLGVNDLAALLSAGRGYDLKTAFAHELAKMSRTGDILAGETGSAVIGARNERALAVLRQQLDSHRNRIGIFYGAAHLPDLEQRLLREFGLVRDETTWVDAWQLAD